MFRPYSPAIRDKSVFWPRQVGMKEHKLHKSLEMPSEYVRDQKAIYNHAGEGLRNAQARKGRVGGRKMSHRRTGRGSCLDFRPRANLHQG
jgi:hypothetical protein